MKKTIVFLISIFYSINLLAQIDDELMKQNWKVGKTKTIYNNLINRSEGKNDIRGITNVGYQTFDQVKIDLLAKAEREMWTEQKKNEAVSEYEKFAKGGLIHLYFTRLTIDAANTKMFTIIVKDSTEKEIYREELKSNIPNTPISGSNYWWNYTSLPIKDTVSGKIFIYIIDKLNSENGKFKFEVDITVK
jgi:hypothetical protein